MRVMPVTVIVAGMSRQKPWALGHKLTLFIWILITTKPVRSDMWFCNECECEHKYKCPVDIKKEREAKGKP